MNELKNALGPLWETYNNDSLYEMFVDSYDDVYYEMGGKIHNLENVFKTPNEVESVIRSLAKYAGKEVSKDTYIFDFTIDLTTRVMAVLPPVSLRGPSFSIIKFPKKTFGFDDYVKFEAIDSKGKELLESIVKEDKNILVAGPAGSGKTTLLNLLVNEINKEYRVVTIEKSASLVLDRKRVARLQTASSKDSEMVELVKAAYSMRGDYIILNDIIGPETMSYIDLIRDGHSGMALTSGENIFDVIKRVELKALSSDFSGTLDDVRYAIGQCFDYIVFQEKVDSGKRKVTRIAEVSYEEGEIKLNVVYKQ